jgi:thioesterase domain-containing protein
MARQLEEMGEKTLLVVMIDSWIATAHWKLRSRERLSILWKKTKEQGVHFLTASSARTVFAGPIAQVICFCISPAGFVMGCVLNLPREFVVLS